MLYAKMFHGYDKMKHFETSCPPPSANALYAFLRYKIILRADYITFKNDSYITNL